MKRRLFTLFAIASAVACLFFIVMAACWDRATYNEWEIPVLLTAIAPVAWIARWLLRKSDSIHGFSEESQKKRHLVMRGFFITLLTLCLGGWAWSHYYSSYVAYCHGGYRFYVAIHVGALEAALIENTFHGKGFEFDNVRILSGGSVYFSTERRFLGFYIDWSGFDTLLEVGIPFWFLTIVLTLALFFVWRKTRRPNPARAFPVETVKT